jgi:branched-chain amino acid aminotransferase
MAFVPFDDRDGWIWVNGDFVPWREAKTHVLTHALHYGSSVFEGERMYGGEIFKLTQHSERLKRSANLLDFEIPYSVAEIDALCNETCAKNGLTDCYVRPVAYLGPEQTSVSALNNKVHLAIAVWDWPSYFDPEVKARGLKLEWSKWRRPDPATAPTTAKAAGLYMICTMSKNSAERRGFADALMLDWRGYVAEATGVTSTAVPVRKHSEKSDSSSGRMSRTTTSMPLDRAISMTVWRVMPSRMWSTLGVWMTPSLTKKTLAPVASAT